MQTMIALEVAQKQEQKQSATYKWPFIFHTSTAFLPFSHHQVKSPSTPVRIHLQLGNMSAEKAPTISVDAVPEASPSPELSPCAFGVDFTPLPAYKAAGTTETDLAGLLVKPLRLHEDLSPGCGGQLWPAGMMLAQHMLRHHREDLRESRMTGLALTMAGGASLEIGAGGGLVGLAVATGCAIGNPLFITDQEDMYPLIQQNIGLNDLGGKVKPAVLNWGEPLAPDIVAFKPDVVLAADCVYFEPAFPLLLTTLTYLLTLCPSATIYFSFKKRRRADMQFFKKARKAFNITEAEDENRTIFNRQGLFLYTITNKANSNTKRQ
ncbi:Uu.00g106770.m01.CDS01 [Anthostomella pinea]|uniref:Protein-lysine N-methyltransferase EFM6 n=1 Tax=Anthostomella pinea TaxID=933095 RepID=A0AAI8YFU3_9PEZI|nr:Uu.00g106770.m01.CDS01 [Anthostomella pinea]